MLGVCCYDVLACISCREDAQLLSRPSVPEILVFFARIYLAVDTCSDAEKWSNEKGYVAVSGLKRRDEF